MSSNIRNRLKFAKIASVLRSHTLRIPTTTTYRIINRLIFIDTNICSKLKQLYYSI